MKVLQLVNSKKSFFENQVKGLEQNGVTVDTLCVPKSETIGETADRRSVIDYLRYYPSVLKYSLEDYDIIHSNFALTAPFAIAQPTRPIVLTLWGSDLMGQYGGLSNRLASQFDAVILPSEAMVEYLDCDYEYVPFGIDTDVFRPIDRERARAEIGWETEDRIVLFPYPKHRDEKNYSRAKRVVEMVETRLAKNIQLKRITGQPHEKVPYYISASDALLITSDRESGPMTVKEAALCNVPVVSTDVGFVRDTIDDVRNSYVCKSEDEIVDSLEKALRTRVRSDGRKYASVWGLEEMGERLHKIYKSAQQSVPV